MKPRESAELASKRWEELSLLQSHYSEFIPFLEDVMAELGFSTTCLLYTSPSPRD